MLLKMHATINRKNDVEIGYKQKSVSILILNASDAACGSLNL